MTEWMLALWLEKGIYIFGVYMARTMVEGILVLSSSTFSLVFKIEDLAWLGQVGQ